MGYKADGLRSALDAAGHEGVSITYVEEPEPLGTAGAIKFAQEHLDERFLVLNGDTLADYDLSAEIAQHAATGARAPIDATSASEGLEQLRRVGGSRRGVEHDARLARCAIGGLFRQLGDHRSRSAELELARGRADGETNG